MPKNQGNPAPAAPPPATPPASPAGKVKKKGSATKRIASVVAKAVAAIPPPVINVAAPPPVPTPKWVWVVGCSCAGLCVILLAWSVFRPAQGITVPAPTVTVAADPGLAAAVKSLAGALPTTAMQAAQLAALQNVAAMKSAPQTIVVTMTAMDEVLRLCAQNQAAAKAAGVALPPPAPVTATGVGPVPSVFPTPTPGVTGSPSPSCRGEEYYYRKWEGCPPPPKHRPHCPHPPKPSADDDEDDAPPPPRKVYYRPEPVVEPEPLPDPGFACPVDRCHIRTPHRHGVRILKDMRPITREDENFALYARTAKVRCKKCMEWVQLGTGHRCGDPVPVLVHDSNGRVFCDAHFGRYTDDCPEDEGYQQRRANRALIGPAVLGGLAAGVASRFSFGGHGGGRVGGGRSPSGSTRAGGPVQDGSGTRGGEPVGDGTGRSGGPSN